MVLQFVQVSAFVWCRFFLVRDLVGNISGESGTSGYSYSYSWLGFPVAFIGGEAQRLPCYLDVHEVHGA